MQPNSGKSFWGYGIAIAIVLFMILTMGLVFFSATLRFDQVTETHYEDAAVYQDRIEAKQRVSALDEPILIDLSADKLLFVLNTKENIPIDSAKFQLYKPDNQALDRRLKFLSLKTGDSLAYDLDPLEAGKWSIKAQWWAESREYFVERTFQIP